jgi:RNA polymerase sigma factor (sigma-70 family)
MNSGTLSFRSPQRLVKRFDDLPGFERTLLSLRIKELRTFCEPIITASAGESVKAGNSSSAGGDGVFRTTRWSLILNSVDVQAPKSRAALSELCKLYWYPLYAFARRSGHDAADAEDLTQSFFLHLLEKEAFTRVGPEKGRFRSFLLASFKNHMSVSWRKGRAAKRGGGCEVVSLDEEEAEYRYRVEPAEDLTPEKIFDARWATTLLARVTSRLREEYVKQGKTEIFERLKLYLVKADQEEVSSYRRVADELGLSVAGVKTLIFRLRKRFTAVLREEVAQTLVDPAEVDSELHALCEALLAAGGAAPSEEKPIRGQGTGEGAR